MTKLKRIIFLHSVFTEKFIKTSQAVSAASNLWSFNFLKNLKYHKIKVICAGIEHNPSWPKGKFYIKASKKNYVYNFVNKKFNYINLYLFKTIYLFYAYLNYLLNFTFKKGDLVVIFNNSFIAKVLQLLNFYKKIPWVCIVADLNYPKKANGYVYLNWNYFNKIKKKQKKLFLDGGIYEFKSQFQKINKKVPTIIYSGSIGDINSPSGYTGLENLLEAFSKLKIKNINLWIFGKGESKKLNLLIKNDKRVKFYGFVNQKKLISLCEYADVFINPRPSKINKFNFPSKVLLYLNFNKPIISNKIGLHPKYNNVLFILKNEKIDTLAKKIEEVISFNKKKLNTVKKNTIKFKQQNSWNFQTKKFINWINIENIYK